MQNENPNFFRAGVNHRRGTKRRSKGDGRPGSRKVYVSVTKETHERITNFAASKGLSVSKLIRNEISKGAA